MKTNTRALTRFIIVFTLLLWVSDACSSTPPTASPAPTATKAEIATNPPVPGPTASPNPTSTASPTIAPAPSGVVVPIGELAGSKIGDEASITGQVIDTASFSQGFKFRLDDGTGQITLLTWLETYDTIVGREGLRTGASVQVKGEIDQFEGELEIVPANGTDVVILAPGTKRAPERESGSLTFQDVGNWVSVEGKVVGTKAFSSGERIYLDDGSGEVMLLLWQNVLERLPGSLGAPAVGSQIHAIGRVEEYQGALEIVPALPFDVDIDHKTTTDTPTPTNGLIPIGELDAGQTGDKVAITGQVTDTTSFSSGFKFTLDDGTGQIILLVWHNIYDELHEAAQLNIGATVNVTGELSEFEGELQIEPNSASDVQLTVPGGSPPPQRGIGTIAAYLGQRITVLGRVVRVEDTGSGTTILVADDSGEALVYVWNNILERIPSSQALSKPGIQVRFTGIVQEYHGHLEIVPALPFDVEILE